MYKSPIDLIYNDVLYRMEENIFTAVQNVGINVDRDELIKALEYDRGQYKKGYADAKAERKKGKWIITDTDIINRVWHCNCTECGEDPIHFISGTEDWWLNKLPNFCPNCGADMRGENDV